MNCRMKNKARPDEIDDRKKRKLENRNQFTQSIILVECEISGARVDEIALHVYLK